MDSSLGALLGNAAQTYGDKTALVFRDQRWSFSELDSAASSVASCLLDEGIQPGDVISLYSPNCAEWIITYYAVLKIGGVVNPLNLMLTPEEAAYAMNDCGAVAVFGAPEKISALRPVLGRTTLRHCIAFGPGGDGIKEFSRFLAHPIQQIATHGIVDTHVCTVAYTSGTTGHPKGALLTHRAILLNTAMTATMHMRTQSDTVVSALPCSHVYGNIVLNTAVAYGMTLVLHDIFDASQILSAIESHQATLFEGMRTMYAYLLQQLQRDTYDLSCLKRCTVGGQTMSIATMHDVEAAFGCPLIELWGMTELGGLGTTHSLYGPRKLGSIGTALPHLEARICDAERPSVVLGTETVGELQIRGPITMKGYLGLSNSGEGPLSGDGWLRTGDLARMDEDGCIYIVDRLKDMIITGGFNIYPAEIERVLADHPDVAMAAVAGLSDAVKGELAKAFVVLKSNCSPNAAELELYCRERLAAYKVPRAWKFLPDLPKTSSGTVLRQALRDQV